MSVTTIPCIRRKAFEIFFYSHQLYFLFLFFYLLQVGINFFCLILPGVYLFLIDRYLCILQSRQNVRLDSARLLPCEAIKLKFSKEQWF
ncbi:putative ferric reduction oxidase 1 [Acorus gramineus]|uniref:Ferric reduction oxidase 1 n=1 Tax=Acorus gramineus TaxID=55184 RepID=A0AAV9B9M9_ACOGR|nr:putative ferric reduction oxidase 1 [Acorus gramineus]